MVFKEHVSTRDNMSNDLGPTSAACPSNDIDVNELRDQIKAGYKPGILGGVMAMRRRPKRFPINI